MTAACPYCRAPIEPEDESIVCEACATPHHADCFAENGGCTVFGCSQAPVDEPKVTVTGSEAAQAINVAPAVSSTPVAYVPPPSPTRGVPPARPVTVERPPSVLGLSEPLSLDGREMSPVELSAPAPFLSAAPDQATAPDSPPPPLPAADSTSAPPPPLPAGSPVPQWTQASEPPLSLAEAYASYHPPKSRVTFVLLGIFLGALGVHNFYAGYIRKAVFQLCLTLFTCFYGSIVSWIWAVAEVCIVKQDNEGVQFTS